MACKVKGDIFCYGEFLRLPEDAFQQSHEGAHLVKAQSGVAYYDEYEWVGSLQLLEPGQGYKIKNAGNSQRSYSYPGSLVSFAPTRTSGRGGEASGMFQPVDYHLYSNNLTMAAKIVKSGKPLANAEVGVFADGECRASAVSDETGIVYLTVPGDDAVTLDLKIVQGSEVTDIKEFVEYQSDAILGTPKSPLTLDVDSPTGVIGLEKAVIESVYDLQGRKANGKSDSGIRIINGQKRLGR